MDRSSKPFIMLTHEFLDAYAAELGATDLAVYISLKRFAFCGELLKKRELIGELIGVSVSSVKRALARLEELLLIEIEHRTGKNGFKIANKITLLEPPPKPCTYDGSQRTVDGSQRTDNNVIPLYVIPVPPKGGSSAKAPPARSAAQKKPTTSQKNAKRAALWDACLNGLGIEKRTALDEMMRGPAFRAMTPPVLDDPKINPSTITTLARWAKGFYAWKGTLPSFREIIKAMPQWEQLGRPREFIEKPRPGQLVELAPVAATEHERHVAHLARISDRTKWTAADRRMYGPSGSEDALNADKRRLSMLIKDGAAR